MDEFNKYLIELALEAQQHPPKTRRRQILLQTLWCEISNSGRLYKPPRERIPSSLNYAQVYNEALRNLMFHICHKIDEYDPERTTVLGWVNFLLTRRFVGNAIQKGMEETKRRIQPRSMSSWNESNPTDIANPENIGRPEDQPPLLSDQVRQCLEADPWGEFKQKYVKDHPQAHFQAIAIRYLDGLSWQTISDELGVSSIQTLSSFYRRSLQQFAPKIKQYVQEQ